MHALAPVTGASAGIGLEIAKQLAARGYDIAGVGASGRIGELGSKLTPDTGVPGPGRADDPAGCGGRPGRGRVLGQTAGGCGPNAGRSLGRAFLDTDIDDEPGMIQLNITSQVLLAKRVVRKMAEQRHGRILITASLSALTPTPYESIYGPTPAFMFGFGEGLREEMKAHGVSVTALLPGATATEFYHRAGMGGTVFGSNEWKNEPKLVARRGVDALFAGKDHVVGGDLKTRRGALLSRVLPERVKAARFARSTRPRRSTAAPAAAARPGVGTDYPSGRAPSRGGRPGGDDWSCR